MSFFRKKKRVDMNISDNSKPTEQTKNETFFGYYPRECDFYHIEKEEWGGAIPIHSVRISFVIPYNDWCEFEKSSLYQHLKQYLLQLHKRDNLHVTKALEDLQG